MPYCAFFCCTGRRISLRCLLSPHHNKALLPHQTDVCYRGVHTVISIYFRCHLGTVVADSRRLSLFFLIFYLCLCCVWQPTFQPTHSPLSLSALAPPKPLHHQSKQRTKCRERLGLTSRENWKGRRGRKKHSKKSSKKTITRLYPICRCIRPETVKRKKSYFHQARGGVLCLYQATSTETVSSSPLVPPFKPLASC